MKIQQVVCWLYSALLFITQAFRNRVRQEQEKKGLFPEEVFRGRGDFCVFRFHPAVRLHDLIPTPETGGVVCSASVELRLHFDIFMSVLFTDSFFCF